MTKFFYRVLEGDTVLALSAKFNIPPSRIISQNKLKREVCMGDLLFLERDENKWQLYRVGPLDDAQSVCKKFDIEEGSLLSQNCVDYLFYGLLIEVDK